MQRLVGCSLLFWERGWNHRLPFKHDLDLHAVPDTTFACALTAWIEYKYCQCIRVKSSEKQLPLLVLISAWRLLQHMTGPLIHVKVRFGLGCRVKG